jgi:hypothetical protein
LYERLCDIRYFPQATICAKSLRTVNTNAECGAPDDFWYQ